MVFFQDQWHLLISKHSNSDARFLAKIKVHSWTRHKLYAPAIVIVVRCACMSWLILWGALAIAPCILLYVNRRELNSLVGSQNRFKCDWIYGFFMQQFFFSSTSFYSSVVRPSWHSNMKFIVGHHCSVSLNLHNATVNATIWNLHSCSHRPI